MISKDLRSAVREKSLLSNLLSYAKDYRTSYDAGGPVKSKPPINIDKYLELGIQIASMNYAERENLQFMLEKLGIKKLCSGTLDI